MNRPVESTPVDPAPIRPPQGYTLVEILVATVLTLLMMAAVVRIFAQIGDSVSTARTTLEMSDQVRVARSTLKSDLEGLTAILLPPRHPETGEGYFEYIEGEIGPVRTLRMPGNRPLPAGYNYAIRPNPDDPDNPLPDFTVGDVDDILLLTVRSSGRPFVGRALVKRALRPDETAADADGSDQLGPFKLERSVESQYAEVIYFVRGTTLYRRVLLILPKFDADLRSDGTGEIATSDEPQMQLSRTPPYDEVTGTYGGFYADYDISVRLELQNNVTRLVPNSLGDLTKRECRFAHPATDFPHDASEWGKLRLPTLRECSSESWDTCDMPTRSLLVDQQDQIRSIDYWNNPLPWPEVDPETGTYRTFINDRRVAEDVLLINVLSFDVKIWDPGAPILTDGVDVVSPGDPDYQNRLADTDNWDVLSYGAYVDLGYAPGYSPGSGVPQPQFHKNNYDPATLDGGPRSDLERVYDTWSSHYEHDGEDQFPQDNFDEDRGTNGFDDDGVAGVDDPGEMETKPPYPFPARGIQIKIRAYEPDGRRIREVTIVQDFLPK